MHESGGKLGPGGCVEKEFERKMVFVVVRAVYVYGVGWDCIRESTCMW